MSSTNHCLLVQPRMRDVHKMKLLGATITTAGCVSLAIDSHSPPFRSCTSFRWQINDAYTKVGVRERIQDIYSYPASSRHIPLKLNGTMRQTEVCFKVDEGVSHRSFPSEPHARGRISNH